MGKANGAPTRNGNSNGSVAEKMMSTRGEFVEILQSRPDLLGVRNNDEMIRLWLERHPEYTEMPRNVRNTLANLKSQLRKKDRARGALFGSSANGNGHAKASTLESLEVAIDDALTLARSIDPVGLEDIVRLLRRARNAVVWKLGQ